ncbi:MAG: hypothetical protein HY716_00500 [Planctomycetes bacterium]|nr:hypothetical protein [Planctomycetota bacterium]
MGARVVRTCLVFAVSFVALFAVMSIHAPGATSQDNEIIRRMVMMHMNQCNHLGFLDATKRPTPTAQEVVGKFISAIG